MQRQTILTGDQKYTDHIATEQRVSRHSSRPDVFYFFSHRTFLKPFLASRTCGTFGFAPTHKAEPSAKPKEPLFGQRFRSIFINADTMHRFLFTLLHNLKNVIIWTH
jgi:hypothetical protein